jgi:dienelactone hydrolase
MAHVLLFHHVLGLTEGVRRYADQIRAAGHEVHVPDLFDGARFATIDEGLAHLKRTGFEALIERGVAAASALPARSVFAGFSMGTMPAQKLAQTRPDTLAAILYHGNVPIGTFGDTWPRDVALQVHICRDDKWSNEDQPEQLVRAAANAELFVYPGSSHLFTDDSLEDYDPRFAALALERTLQFLKRLE